MNILEFCRITKAYLKIEGNVDPGNSKIGNWINVSLVNGRGSARTTGDEDRFSFGRNTDDLPSVNEAGENMVGGLRGREIVFGAVARAHEKDAAMRVPDDLEWGISLE